MPESISHVQDCINCFAAHISLYITRCWHVVVLTFDCLVQLLWIQAKSHFAIFLFCYDQVTDPVCCFVYSRNDLSLFEFIQCVSEILKFAVWNFPRRLDAWWYVWLELDMIWFVVLPTPAEVVAVL